MERDLQRELARLESLYDQLESEVIDLDKLLKKVGFSHGLKSIKETAQELTKEQD